MKKNRVSAGTSVLAVAVAMTAVSLGLGGCTGATDNPTDPVSVTRPVDEARVTGYTASPLTGRPSGPVSVALRGESAARIDQLINGLQVTKLALVCAEEAQLYQITFSVVASAKRGLDVTGYQCGGLVVITSKGKTLTRTDRNCTLLSAVRRLLPASATATQRLDAPCAS